MSTIDHIETFRAEHRGLISRVTEIGALADSLDEMSTSDRVAGIDNVLYFLRNVLVPHALAEEQVLYPAVGAILGDPRATAPMELDHLAIAELSQALAATDPDHVVPLRRLLHALDTLIRHHFRAEEELYLPLLEAEPEEYVADLIGRLHRTVHTGAVR